MRIGHVNLASGYRGGERQTELLIKLLAEQNTNTLEQWVFCRSEKLKKKLAGIPNIYLIHTPNQLLCHFKAPKLDIVHAHDAKGVHWAFIHKLLLSTPYLLTRRVPQTINATGMKKLFYGQASQIACISNAIKNGIDSAGFKNTQLIPSSRANFIVNKKIVESLKTSQQGKIIIGQVGALVDKHKGQSVLIEAARIINKKYSNIEFHFFGSGSDEQYLKDLAKGIDSIKFQGFKEDIANYIASFDIFAFPSFNEGLGSVLLDVMDLEIPIVASNVDGIPDLIKHKETGLLVDAGKPDQLANALEQIIDAIEGDTRNIDLPKLIANAKVFSDSYDPALMAKAYFSLYNKILND
ncbi:MAG TPA: glycosyltransferase family 4 protein [Marinospirillum sp.]|uniref:glycosyltransferase family 4 protein n=1 Tax=Marinospirillum sp. TaxID=2183934 RepID=UPI002B47A9BF|nr:glycosyltransferase family 4 protein [Marinospirillum sp.]HKM14403.1 glycosyltransferase family 4 protein [Marinospirillum sp.]